MSEPQSVKSSEAPTSVEDSNAPQRQGDVLKLQIFCKKFNNIGEKAKTEWFNSEVKSNVEYTLDAATGKARYVFVKFKSAADTAQFKNDIAELKFKGAELDIHDFYGGDKSKRTRKARCETEERAALRKKRRMENITLKEMREKAKYEKDKTLLEKSAPLFTYSYAEQLRLKEQFIMHAARNFTREVKAHCEKRQYPFPNWARVHKNKPGCTVHEIVGSPETNLEGYRNKCEFTIGYSDFQCSKPEVGFVRRVEGHELLIESGKALPHIPACMKAIEGELRKLVLENYDQVKPFSRHQKKGTWRQVMLRWSPSRDQMLMVVMCCEPYELATNIIKTWAESAANKSLPVPVSSVFMQTNNGVCDACDMKAEDLHHIYGDTRVMMDMLGLEFPLQPASFFQTNVVMCKKLYTMAVRLALTGSPDGDDLPKLEELDSAKMPAAVVDVCSGVGTITQVFASILGPKPDGKPRVYGLELVPDAVEDAKASARANKLDSSVRFIAGRAEETIEDVIKEACSDIQGGQKLTVIVDPPRYFDA
ncbi:RNA m5u methyltransferase, putative [Perkinsus marinus ATCC 50983]|uniref:RNA m5u methyltransferase, putative n=1 Tax=Perkinsus marinus (strain ATCC 50983 / TXsc) TaxID=423536 RepID=C5LHA2_PERM5|nr:RNA m5u methyltransferase, putative [Perkinsus marinus ATCC 50983]EER03911.1 RNA m5u methyltransferase, putative [Perkinsus marinus ATCC 50983]|eukprot:XP_002772095.1 RNA m5u methyltransferase, putative [Perkinsus marinus ATCC 50983]